MKNNSAFVLLTLFVFATVAFRIQDTPLQKLPSVAVKSLDGKIVNTETFSNNGKPLVIDLWSTCCAPCTKELDEINEVYEDWQTETGMKLIAVSTDDQRTSAKVNPHVNSHEWSFEVYLDGNQDLKRALNVNTVPHVFVLNGKGEIVWQNNAYNENSVAKLHDVIAKVAKGEKPE